MDPLSRLYAELAGGALIIAIGAGLWVHHDSIERNKGAVECQAKVSETKSQADEDAAARASARELQYAEAQKEHDDALRNLPPPVTTPVILRVPGAKVCPDFSGLASAPGSVHPSSGAADQGSGERDIRPGITAYELRYEGVIADCNKLKADWPGDLNATRSK